MFWERAQFRNSRVVEEFVPSSAWTEDSNVHKFLVELPDFKKEEVTMQLEDSEHLRVSGERMVNNYKYVYFEKKCRIPKDSDTANITGDFEDDILYITIPKKVEEAKKEPDETQPENVKKESNETQLENVKNELEQREPENEKKEPEKRESENVKKESEQRASENEKKEPERRELENVQKEPRERVPETENVRKEPEERELENVNKEAEIRGNKETVIPEENVQEKPSRSENSNKSNGQGKQKREKKCCLKKLLEKKEILLAVLLAFSLGAVSLSQKFPKAGR